MNKKILTSPFRSSSSKDDPNRSHSLATEVGFYLRDGGLDGRALAKVVLPQGVRPGAGFLVTPLLFSSPSEQEVGCRESHLLFNVGFDSVPFENSLRPTLPPPHIPKY